MRLDTFPAVLLAITFLVPGFIIHATIALAIPRRSEPAQLTLIRLLAYSCLNYGVWSWLVILLVAWPPLSGRPLLSAGLWFIVVLPGPTALGLVLARLSQRGAVQRLFQAIGIISIHPIPAAWDFRFSGMQGRTWVLVTLANDKQVAGIFGEESFASSDPEERDLFLQEVWTVGTSGAWNPVPRSAGILVKADQIRYVEYWTD